MVTPTIKVHLLASLKPHFTGQSTAFPVDTLTGKIGRLTVEQSRLGLSRMTVLLKVVRLERAEMSVRDWFS